MIIFVAPTTKVTGTRRLTRRPNARRVRGRISCRANDRDSSLTDAKLILVRYIYVESRTSESYINLRYYYFLIWVQYDDSSQFHVFSHLYTCMYLCRTQHCYQCMVIKCKYDSVFISFYKLIVSFFSYQPCWNGFCKTKWKVLLQRELQTCWSVCVEVRDH